jgi:hypothetical protein
MNAAEMALYSARYILEDLNQPEGIEALAKITGLTEGVIAEAFNNIFHLKPKEAYEGYLNIEYIQWHCGPIRYIKVYGDPEEGYGPNSEMDGEWVASYYPQRRD